MDELKNLMQIIHTNNMEFHGIIKKSKNRIELKDIKVVSTDNFNQVITTFNSIVYWNYLLWLSIKIAIFKLNINFAYRFKMQTISAFVAQ